MSSSTCEKYEDLLQQYLDRALDSRQTAVLMSHLDVCSHCRLDFKLYKKVVEGLESLEDLTPPGTLRSGVMEQLDRQSYNLPAFPELPAQPANGWFWGLSSAAAAVIAVTSFFLFRADDPANLPVPEMIAQQDQSLPATLVPAPPLEDAVASSRATGQRIRVSLAGGTIQVQRANSSRWEEHTASTDVAYGDKIRTLPGTTARIEYTLDKTTLKLRPSSLVQVLANAVRVFHGDTWIRVDKVGSHFQAETPNAVASVRGTRYSAEVHYPERIARLYEGSLDETAVSSRFVQEYTRNLSDTRMNGLMPLLAYPMHATPVSLAVQVNMLLDAVRASEQAETVVQVFESKVEVASIDPETNREIDSVLVHEGYQTGVKRMQLARLDTLTENDFLKWGLPTNRELLSRVRSADAAARPVAGATGDVTADVTVPSLLDVGPVSDAIDRSDPDFGGVERRQY